jgi:cytosine/adenosine deaminase-related metal-dependent hydrolase
MRKLFKNAKIVDIHSGNVLESDILVEDGKIMSLQKNSNFEGEKIELGGDFVLPSFVNCFCDSFRIFKENYFEPKTAAEFEAAKNLVRAKNLTAGAIFYNDIALSQERMAGYVENLETLDEKTLSKLSLDFAKSKKLPFLKIGQDLNSLGIIDKNFGKGACSVLEDFGFLDRCAVIVGGNCLEKDELQIASGYDCSFVVLPSEDGKFGRRATNLISLRSNGFSVGMGSGTYPEIDFFEMMRALIFGMRSLFESGEAMSERQALEIATNSSILGFDSSIKVGGEATFIVVDFCQSLYDDIFKTLVWQKSNRDIKMCVQSGEVLQKNGKIFMQNLCDCDTIIKNLKR